MSFKVTKASFAITGVKNNSNFGFTIVIRNFPGKQTFDNNLLIQVITSISSSLRLLRTMNYVKKSEICHNILNPKVNILNLSSHGPTISGVSL